MGDEADEAIASLFDPRYEVGDEDDGEICKRCGATDLFWSKSRGGWILRSNADGSEHVCAPTTEGFENLDK